MGKQTSFDFGFVEQLGRHDFFISSCNREAYQAVASWPDWQQRFLLIYGPASSGKTHLAQIWKQKSGAVLLQHQHLYAQDPLTSYPQVQCFIIERIDQIYDEELLLHWYNSLQERQAYLLLTSPVHPASLHVRLPDLRSRLHLTPSIALGAPDEELLRTLFVKQFADRQLKVSRVVIDFIIARMERSFDQVRYIVDRLDRKALAEQRTITIPFVKQLLSHLGTSHETK